MYQVCTTDQNMDLAACRCKRQQAAFHRHTSLPTGLHPGSLKRSQRHCQCAARTVYDLVLCVVCCLLLQNFGIAVGGLAAPVRLYMPSRLVISAWSDGTHPQVGSSEG